jgi:hypothetical protein
MKKVSGAQVVTTVDASESPLPAEIQEALGELDHMDKGPVRPEL